MRQTVIRIAFNILLCVAVMGIAVVAKAQSDAKVQQSLKPLPINLTEKRKILELAEKFDQMKQQPELKAASGLHQQLALLLKARAELVTIAQAFEQAVSARSRLSVTLVNDFTSKVRGVRSLNPTIDTTNSEAFIQQAHAFIRSRVADSSPRDRIEENAREQAIQLFRTKLRVASAELWQSQRRLEKEAQAVSKFLNTDN